MFSKIEVDPDAVVRSHHRLGRTIINNRPRPLLVRVDSKPIRDKVLDKSQKLKDSQEPYKKIYIKKDSHPEVRKEWKRLRDVEQTEKSKHPGSEIRLDFKERVVYKDGVVIDKWRPHRF